MTFWYVKYYPDIESISVKKVETSLFWPYNGHIDKTQKERFQLNVKNFDQ